MKELREYLPFWEILSENEKEKLQNESKLVEYKKDAKMQQCSQGCQGIMIILEGQLRSYIVSEEGREVTLFRVFQDDVCVLSAAGLMDAIVFDVMIDAVEASKILMVSVQILKPLVKKYIEVEAYLYRTAVERFSDVLWIMQQILFLSTDQRVAQFLWDEVVRTKQTTITMTHDEIARYIGSAREVVTKVLKYFQSEGVLQLSRGRIEIVNKDMLKQYLQIKLVLINYDEIT